jgi:hypothetical protein
VTDDQQSLPSTAPRLWRRRVQPRQARDATSCQPPEPREPPGTLQPARPPLPNAEWLARKFHETYERLAPTFGYTTRPETAVPWEAVPLLNQQLMIAVCEELLAVLRALPPAPDDE